MFAAFAEEALHLVGAAAGEHASAYLHDMVELRMVQDIQDGVNGAGLGIIGPIDQALKTRQEECAGAHGAGFDSDENLAVEEAMISELSRSLPKSNNLGVCSGIGTGEILIEAVTHDAVLANDHRADRHLADFKCALSGT